MTQTPEQERVDTEHLRDYSRLRRSVTDRKIAGVAGGLGRHLNIDPTILRVAFVVLAFFGGAGILLYGAVWLFVPDEGSDTAPIQTAPSTRTTILLVAAVVAGLLVVGDSWGDVGFPWPLAVIALVVALVLMNRDKPMTTTHSQQQPDADLVPPAPTAYPVAQPPAPEPYRGPRLFWFTVALLAVALGSLGLYEVAGGAVADAAYPALALAVVGTMLVVGAWFGRPGGLIALGVAAVIGLLGASAGDLRWEDHRVSVAPTTAAQVDDSYRFNAGTTHLDLSRVSDLEALDGRTIDVEGDAGEIVVTIPDDVDVDIRAAVAGAGDVSVLGEHRGGVGMVAVERSVDGGDDVPELSLNLDLMVGNIEVRQ